MQVGMALTPNSFARRKPGMLGCSDSDACASDTMLRQQDRSRAL